MRNALASGKLAQNDAMSERPLTISQKFPVPAADLEVYTSPGNGVQHPLSSRFPSPEKSDVTTPSRVIGRQRAVDLVTISERHKYGWLPRTSYSPPLIRLAINKRIEMLPWLHP